MLSTLLVCRQELHSAVCGYGGIFCMEKWDQLNQRPFAAFVAARESTSPHLLHDPFSTCARIVSMPAYPFVVQVFVFLLLLLVCLFVNV